MMASFAATKDVTSSTDITLDGIAGALVFAACICLAMPKSVVNRRRDILGARAIGHLRCGLPLLQRGIDGVDKVRTPLYLM